MGKRREGRRRTRQPGYQAALKALGKGAERDVRIVEAAG
jgi:hypothetical protein